LEIATSPRALIATGEWTANILTIFAAVTIDKPPSRATTDQAGINTIPIEERPTHAGGIDKRRLITVIWNDFFVAVNQFYPVSTITSAKQLSQKASRVGISSMT
jgi:hypothetical protein